jgi:hypothetical protein
MKLETNKTFTNKSKKKKKEIKRIMTKLKKIINDKLESRD